MRYFVLAVVQMLASAGLVSLLYGVLGGSEVAVKILVDVFLFFISFLIQRKSCTVKERCLQLPSKA